MLEIDSESFTNNLKRLRREHGYTQESLAEKLDMTHSTVNRWESGKNSPGYKDFYKIMQAFNVSFEELAGVPVRDKEAARKPTIEEALKVVADETGIVIKIPKSVRKVSEFDQKISKLDEKRISILMKTIDQLLLSQTSQKQQAN